MPQVSLKKSPSIAAKKTSSKEYPPAFLSWSIWGLGALLYAIGFFQRTAPAVMTNDLMADFNITAGALGHLASFYFYAYVLMQIPTGILSRLVGLRLLMAASAYITAIGTFVFALSDSFRIAAVGLVMVGGAIAMVIGLTLELAGRWLPNHRFALASGLIMVVGVMGAFAAGMPLRLLISSFGWRNCMIGLGGLTLILGTLAWGIVRDDPSERGYQSYSEGNDKGRGDPALSGLIANLGAAFKYRNTWLMLFVPCSLIGAMLSFSGLWGVPYLRARFGLPEGQGALICSFLLISFAVGSPVLGYLSDRQRSRKPIYVSGFLIATACWLAAILVDALTIGFLTVILVVVGFSTGAMPLSYALGRESAPPEISGIVTGIVITGIMAGPAIIQPVTGWLLDRQWNGAVESGIRIYDAGTYRTAFLPMLSWIVIAAILVLMVKETNCGKQRENKTN
jgi:predicted MFS family arabinose efflux permease